MKKTHIHTQKTRIQKSAYSYQGIKTHKKAQDQVMT